MEREATPIVSLLGLPLPPVPEAFFSNYTKATMGSYLLVALLLPPLAPFGKRGCLRNATPAFLIAFFPPSPFSKEQEEGGTHFLIRRGDGEDELRKGLSPLPSLPIGLRKGGGKLSRT